MSEHEQNQEKASNSSSRKTSLEIDNNDKSIFNSKIFIHLTKANDDYLNNLYNQEYENNSESEKDTNQGIYTDYFLISDLIEKIDHLGLNSPKNIDEKLNFDEKKNIEEENLNKTSASLVNKGYSFIPKNYKFNRKSSKEIFSNNTNNKVGSFINKKKTFHEREGDWICNFCNNINFSFRNKCNRCKALKEESIKNK